VNYDNSIVVTITVTCYSWAPSSGDHLFTCGAICWSPQWSRADPASKFRGAISVLFGSQVSLRVHVCKRDEVYLTTLLWQNNWGQNGL